MICGLESVLIDLFRKTLGLCIEEWFSAAVQMNSKASCTAINY